MVPLGFAFLRICRECDGAPAELSSAAGEGSDSKSDGSRRRSLSETLVSLSLDCWTGDAPRDGDFEDEG